jgi:hypothetical protein
MNVLAIWRAGRPIRTRLSNLPLEFGDALLLQGKPERLPVLRADPNLIVLAGEQLPRQLVPAKSSRGLIMVVTCSGCNRSPALREVMLGGSLLMICSVCHHDQFTNR